MSVRTHIAQATSNILTWGLRHIARRPGANLPGIAALKLDPRLIANLRSRITEGSIVVVGTNGKTTVTNLLANALEQAGNTVVCNRTGANLKSGIASALLQTQPVSWGVLECDELWSAKVLPDVQPTYMLLLNLFRDQLDRCGEIDRIQDAIVAGLAASPNTTLIYNADDPLCETVARRAASQPERAQSPASIAFGVDACMHLEQNVVTDATICQMCSHMLTYTYRQYGQLGAYSCPQCSFARPALQFKATNVDVQANSLAFDVTESSNHTEAHVKAPFSGAYMVYNMLAVFTAATCAGCAPSAIQQAITAFNPQNGRLQKYVIDGHPTLLNLAKNPTGFNQNLRIVAADESPRVVAFFINDRDVDGHDISWIWDIDFEELLAQRNIQAVFAGGERKNDLQVRLKYAGVHAELIDGIEDVFARINGTVTVYAIANYTALPPVHAALNHMTANSPGHSERVRRTPEESYPHENTPVILRAKPEESRSLHCEPLRIVHMLPDLLNLYGDGGNVRILAQRLRWRGIPVQVHEIRYGEHAQASLEQADLVFLGGAPDREQRLANETLTIMRDELAQYIADDGPVLAICGGYQMLGRTWILDGEEVPGLNILPMETQRPGTSADRLVNNIALDSPLATTPIIGYENHAGRTVLDAHAQPFGRVISHTGCGNADTMASGNRLARTQLADGILYKNVLGTYLHGPVLAKNPQVADWLLARALERYAARTGSAPEQVPQLEPLDDATENAANAFMATRLVR